MQAVTIAELVIFSPEHVKMETNALSEVTCKRIIRAGFVPAQLVKLRARVVLSLHNNLFSGKGLKDVDPRICSCCLC